MKAVVTSILDSYQSVFGVTISEPLYNHLKEDGAIRICVRYFVLDFFTCFFIIAPAVIAFWRGTWDFCLEYMNAIFDHENHPVSNIICFVFGAVVTQVVQAMQFWLRDTLKMGEKLSLPQTMTYRLFAVIWGFSDIYLWKGIWDGVDWVFDKGVIQGTSTLCTGFISLVLAGATRSLLSVPVGINVDDKDNLCTAHTYLESTDSDPEYKRLGDQFVSLILEILVVLSWHGLWSLEDEAEKFLNHSRNESSWYGLFAGFVGTLIIYFVQFPLAWLTLVGNKRKTACLKAKQFLASLIQNLLGFVTTVTTFRAYWYLLDEYYLVDNYKASLITGAIIGALILMATNCTCCLHAGVFKDVQEVDGMIEFHYFTYFYIKDLQKEWRCRGAFGNGSVYHAQKRHTAPAINVPVVVISQCPVREDEENVQSQPTLLGDHLFDGEMHPDKSVYTYVMDDLSS